MTSHTADGSGPPALALAGVGLTYPGPPRVEALRGVDLTVERGEFVAVVGPSGAGKSSLLHVMGLLTTPTTGRLVLGGEEVASASDRELTDCRGRGIGFVFQSFHLMEGRTAVENVMLPLRYQKVLTSAAQARAEAVLELVGLGHRLYAHARSLSGGERQRVAIARALVTEPEVLLCDEPTGNLDSTNSANVMRLLGDLHAGGRTIIVITHDETVSRSAHRVARLLDGQMTDENQTPSPTDAPAAAPTPPHQQPEPPPRAERGAGSLGPVGLLDEALAGLFERGPRTVLTCLGTLLGVATLVAILGLASTASGQISKRFDRLAATTVTAEAGTPASYDGDRLARAGRLNGVTGIGLLRGFNDATITSDPTQPDAVAATSLPVVAATPGAWEVIEPTLVWGRTFDDALDDQRVAVLGSGAAYQLGIHGPLGTQSVLIDKTPYLILGVFNDVQRRPDLLLSVVVPSGGARASWGKTPASSDSQIVVKTVPGAGRQVAAELPYALLPEKPTGLITTPPPDPRELREDVGVDLSGLFLMLAAVTLIVGMVGIANTSLVAVLERTREIGLRRALGSHRSDIRHQFLTEAALIGAIGGVLGTLLGLSVVIGVSLAHDWTPVISRLVLLSTPCAGLACGVLAGLLPARRAARIDPTEALRQ